MSERFVKYFWEAIQFTTEKFQSDADTCEYIYFYDMRDSRERKDIIFPFLLSHENANARRVCDVVKLYFPHFGEIDDVAAILNHGLFSLYGFRVLRTCAARTLILSAPLFVIPTFQSFPTFPGAAVQQDPRYRRPYRDVEMQQMYDYFRVVVTFPEGALVLTSPVTMAILTEGINCGLNSESTSFVPE